VIRMGLLSSELHSNSRGGPPGRPRAGTVRPPAGDPRQKETPSAGRRQPSPAPTKPRKR
jgi:hypothetical protein